MQSNGLLVNLIRNGSVRSWTVNQDVNGRSVGGHRVGIVVTKMATFKKTMPLFSYPLNLS
jgi:hypothetical protein